MRYRHIVHIHIPAFPITVARVGRPELRDRPVVVAPSRSERAPVLCVSPEARAEGIFKGIPLFKAIKRCPGLRILPLDPTLSERALGDLGRIVSHYTPLWEPARPGHLYLDLTGTERLWGRVRDTGLRVRREIGNRLSLPGTVGVAGNKLVSSIASRVMPGEELLDVVPGREAFFLAPLRVDLLPGIGRDRKRTLMEELRIVRIRQLAALDMDRLRLIFGRRAFLIHQRALGIDPTPVHPVSQEPVIGEERVLDRDENDDRVLLGTLYGLVQECAFRLRRRGLLPRRAMLRIRYADQVETTRHLKLPYAPLCDQDLYEFLERLFFRACTRRVAVRSLGVRFRDLAPPSRQLSLFHGTGNIDPGKEALTRALDRIRDRHGPGAVRYGRAV
ncbi:MAG: DNA polymerase IV [Deltaproteobacteria bacterium]|nr:DNA polymerase IV [Deltaproteobacteria bacterium]MBW1924792.1 DNA polymerase IV [Deltaproteobacteria bacterium]MBW1948307.1 DNA polymerase IV [Deltaproteobacteria bacterium]MBW2008840.1 DNA polymerase IV [Deltaproteobacteria bacterium]